MDTVSKKQRSQIMAKVKSKDTKLEVNFRKILRKLGCRFKKNVGDFFGKPDFVLSKIKTVIFIDSCFWHGCAKHCRIPTSRKKYWINKIQRNKKRDTAVNRYYKNTGWQIIRIWEHRLTDIKAVTIYVEKSLKRTIKVNTGSRPIKVLLCEKVTERSK